MKLRNKCLVQQTHTSNEQSQTKKKNFLPSPTSAAGVRSRSWTGPGNEALLPSRRPSHLVLPQCSQRPPPAISLPPMLRSLRTIYYSLRCRVRNNIKRFPEVRVNGRTSRVFIACEECRCKTRSALWAALAGLVVARKEAAGLEGMSYYISEGGTCSYTINAYYSEIRVRCLTLHSRTGTGDLQTVLRCV